jgi:hypothetical protein
LYLNSTTGIFHHCFTKIINHAQNLKNITLAPIFTTIISEVDSAEDTAGSEAGGNNIKN